MIVILQNGLTPLHWSSMNGYVDIVNALLSHGADICVKDEVSKH